MNAAGSGTWWRRMTAAAFFVAVLPAVGAPAAEDVLRTFDWSEPPATGQVREDALEIVNERDTPVTVTLLTIDDPGITGRAYALSGSVGYEAVQGSGYLEMWNHFSDGSRYFSRTLSDHGPMGRLSGTSPPRPFVLPFTISGDTPSPSKLVVNVVLPGRGRVRLSPVELLQFEHSVTFGVAQSAGAWWDQRTGGLVGGIAGTCLGLAGALIGMLGGLGRARRFVFTVMALTFAAGAVALVASFTAIVTSQPYAVFYPLLIVGLIATCVTGGVLPGIRKRYEQIEMRRMQAMDMT